MQLFCGEINYEEEQNSKEEESWRALYEWARFSDVWVCSLNRLKVVCWDAIYQKSNFCRNNISMEKDTTAAKNAIRRFMIFRFFDVLSSVVSTFALFFIDVD